jgi:aminomethyltransferase
MKTVHTDVDTEYDALRHSTGLVDLAGAGLVRVSGPGAATLLGLAFSRNVDFLLEGQISAALMLREDGTVVSEALIHCDGAEYLVEIWPAQRAAAVEHLTSIALRVPTATVRDVSDEHRVIAVEGPESFRIAGKYVSFPIASMAYRSFVTEEWNGARLLVSRTGVTGEYGYKLHVPAELGDALHQEIAGLGAQPVGLAALDTCRMEIRFVNLERESGGAPITPFAVGLQWMTDLQHDFVGRAALQAAWDGGLDQLPICWQADEAVRQAPEHGAPLAVDGTPVGVVTHAVWSPSLQRVVGAARVDRAVASSGVEFDLAGHPARSVSGPFLVATSFGRPME